MSNSEFSQEMKDDIQKWTEMHQKSEMSLRDKQRHLEHLKRTKLL